MTPAMAEAMARMLGAAYPRSGATADTWTVYTKALLDLEDSEIRPAIEQCIETHERLPPVAAIRQVALDIRKQHERAQLPGLPDGGESERARAAARRFFEQSRRRLEELNEAGTAGPLAAPLLRALTADPSRRNYPPPVRKRARP